MRPFFSYYGGKWRDAVKLYPAPSHDTIVEPFAGSAGYALRYHDRRVVLADEDEIVAGVWQYLVGVSTGEVLGLPDLDADQTVDDLDVCQEARWLIGFWLNRASSSPRKSPSAWMRSGVRPGCFWGDGARMRIARQVPLIRHWDVRNCSYRDVDIGEATWFVDPPYQGAGRHYRVGSATIDYDHLGSWCRSRRGQVIVCEADGAEWLPFSPIGTTKTARRGSRSREAVWVKEAA